MVLYSGNATSAVANDNRGTSFGAGGRKSMNRESRGKENMDELLPSKLTYVSELILKLFRRAPKAMEENLRGTGEKIRV